MWPFEEKEEIDYCAKGRHRFIERYDEEIIKQHESYGETQVKKTYLFDICTICGKIVYPLEEEEELEKKE